MTILTLSGCWTTVNAGIAMFDSAKVGPSDSVTVVRFIHAKRSDVRFLQNWKRAARSLANPNSRDSASLAALAFAKWSQCRRERRVGSSLREAMDLIRDNPHQEVAMLVLAKSQVRGAAMAGVCHFRRTWCNNVMVDYVAVHPRYVRAEERRFKALGPCLLWYVAEFAADLEANTLWLEATQNSAPAYQRVFGLRTVRDLVVLNRTQYSGFRDSMRRAQGLEG